MLEKLIGYFAKRHLLTNFFVLSIFVGGLFTWSQIKKEELPDITFDRIRVSAVYPGAPAADVEYFVTKPLEEALRGLDGIHRVKSTSSVGQSNVTIELELGLSNVDEVVTEIRNTVLDVKLPEEVRDEPRVRVFKTSKKAILDVALIYKDQHLLDTDSRSELQRFALALENQLLNLPEVNSINRSGYLEPELQIKVDPEKLRRYDLPFNTVLNEIKENNLRQPAGSLETPKEPKVTISSELNDVKKLKNLIIQGGFNGQMIRLKDVADVSQGYKKNKMIYKVNGHEAVMFNVVKNSGYGILEALAAVVKSIKGFEKATLKGTPLGIVLLDDESIDIRNRLSIIGFNGTIGFLLILGMLFIFLNKRSGIWVAVGIPFTFCFTLIFSSLMGYTVNGTTLAAVIIVMGIIVDDAIVVAENITRLIHKGFSHESAVVKGTSFVLLPIIASIVTTCIAFVPLFFFTGHFGKFVENIPPIIFIMLTASFIESIFILPGHMNFPLSFSKKREDKYRDELTGHWFEDIEDRYGRQLEKILPYRRTILLGFVALLFFSGWVAFGKMKFVLFPHEETRDIVLSGFTRKESNRFDTAKKTKEIESVVDAYMGQEVVGYRTEIARSRRGGAVKENQFRMIIEIVPKEERKESADQIIKKLKKGIAELKGFEKVNFRKSRWGHSSGSPIELIIQQNNEEKRQEIVQLMEKELSSHTSLENVEIDEPMRVLEYKIDINREKMKRLSIEPRDVASTFRAALEGTILYEFSNGDEDIQTRFTVIDSAKDDIQKVLSLPVQNRGNYLVPLRDVVFVEEGISPNSISRRDMKRTTIIDADIKKKSKQTPVEIASFFESSVFPQVLSKYPTTTLSFGGEVLDTRESKQDLKNAIWMALFLIYVILAILFNSLTKPLIIMLAIPFGIVGVILAFWLHGKTMFGFYAAIGALGLSGVVINDAIIMLVKINEEYVPSQSVKERYYRISQVVKTRLRAILLTTLTTVAGVLPTAYGFVGYDAMLADMMLSLTWGLLFGTLITLLLIPCIYCVGIEFKEFLLKKKGLT